jgi:Ornithine cyclodeaminase/mu-crystallin family
MTAPAAMPYLDADEIARRLGPAGAFHALEGALLAGLDPEGDPPRAVLEVDGGQLLVMPSVAARHPVHRLASPDAARLLVFGRGPQAKAHVEAMRRIRPIEHVDLLGRDRGDVEVDGSSPRPT